MSEKLERLFKEAREPGEKGHRALTSLEIAIKSRASDMRRALTEAEEAKGFRERNRKQASHEALEFSEKYLKDAQS